MRHQSASLPPNPSLVAVLLVTRSRAGPHLVFHYPAVPSPSPYYTKRDPNWYGTPGNQTEESGGSDEDWSSEAADETDDEEDASSKGGSRGSKVKSSTGRVRISGQIVAGMEIDEENLENTTPHGRRLGEENHLGNNGGKKEEAWTNEWDRLLGFSADGLSALLSPTKSFNKRKFEVGIEQFVFVGAPIFVRDDGYWKKRRRHRKKESVDNTHEHEGSPEIHRTEHNENMTSQTSLNRTGEHNIQNSFGVKRQHRETDLELVSGFEAAYGHGLVSGAASEQNSDQRSTSTTTGHGEMKMFNVVFVLNPPCLEHHIRVDEMYDFIIKRFAKALKYEQAQNNYVAHESNLIMRMKERGKESKLPLSLLWPQIISSSALAKSIAITFDSISTNRIAHINLNDFDTSFQIPQVISTPFIPTATDPQMPGLWLTTATLIDDEEADASLSPHSALLLLQDDEALLKEVENDGKELSGPLAFFIRNLTPTKSLLKLSQRHSMPIKDVQFLARHLIYWRRARAIPPLNRRDTYVVSPNADLRALNTAVIAFETKYPTLPSLPKVLHLLSERPRQYKSFMPSQDHRTAYMDILAWLMRGGWVTQLREFAWVKVSREVKAAVAAKANRDARHSLAMRVRIEGETVNWEHTDDKTQTPSPHIQRSPETRGITEMNMIYPSPLLSPHRSPAGPPSDTGSTSSSRTTVQSISALSPLQRPESRTFHRPSPLHINQSASLSSQYPSSPSVTNTVSISGIEFKSENPKDYEPSLVHSPQKASNEESAWIEHIGSMVKDMFDTEDGAKELWPTLLKYFDGKFALEEISGQEGLKKKKVRDFLAELKKKDVLITVRHW